MPISSAAPADHAANVRARAGAAEWNSTYRAHAAYASAPIGNVIAVLISSSGPPSWVKPGRTSTLPKPVSPPSATQPAQIATYAGSAINCNGHVATRREEVR